MTAKWNWLDRKLGWREKGCSKWRLYKETGKSMKDGLVKNWRKWKKTKQSYKGCSWETKSYTEEMQRSLAEKIKRRGNLKSTSAGWELADP